MKAGDKVSWTHVSSGGRTLSMRLREGIIESIEGDAAVVKKSGGKRERVTLVRLRVEGQKSQIAEFVEVMRDITR